MHTDVTDLRDFYQTPLGLVARRLLAQKIRATWPRASTGANGVGKPSSGLGLEANGPVVMGFGFASPFLGSFRGEASRICALMPTGQGALVWPTSDRNMSVLVEEEHLPLPDNSVDRMLIIHGLEVAERPAALLREMWRVLTPTGRLLIVVPNRTGIWARTDRTPFGQGRPYSRGQLDRLLREAMFTPLNWNSALHLPPIHRALIVRSAPTIERLGAIVSPRFAGVILAEATKEVISPIGLRAPGNVLRNLVPLPTVLVPQGARRGREHVA
jgi:SAM-dependent methyltransferase